MNRIRFLQMVLILALGSVSAMTSALQPMDDSDLSAVTGQEGVALELEFRINTDANGNPLGSLTNCAGGLDSECRYALRFNNRNDLGGEWLLFRGAYGFVGIQDINLDAGILSQAGDSDTLFDDTKFRDSGGVCLISGGCSDGNIQSKPSLVFQYPTPTASYNAGSQASSGYDSLKLGLNLDTAVIAYGANAYNDTTTTGSFLGVKVRDTNGGLAGVAITGKAYVYGF